MLFIFILGLLLTTSLLEIKAQQKDLAGTYKSNDCDNNCCCPQSIALEADSKSNGSYSFKDFQIQGPNCTALEKRVSSVNVGGQTASFPGVTVTLLADHLQIDITQVNTACPTSIKMTRTDNTPQNSTPAVNGVMLAMKVLFTLVTTTFIFSI